MEDGKAIEWCMEIYRRLYKAAKPSADFDRLVAKKITLKSGWYLKYYLPQPEMDRIVEDFLMEKKIKPRIRQAIRTEIYLGCSPTSDLETWKVAKKKVMKK